MGARSAGIDHDRIAFYRLLPSLCAAVLCQAKPATFLCLRPFAGVMKRSLPPEERAKPATDDGGCNGNLESDARRPRLSLDTEPVHGDVPSRMGEAGPCSPDDILGWPDLILPRLPLLYYHELINKVHGGIRITEDFAGIGTGSAACAHLQAALRGRGEDIGDGACFRCIRASGRDSTCRHALSKHIGEVVPQCIMGDMLLRSPPEVARMARSAALVADSEAKARVVAGEDKQVVHRDTGTILMEQLKRIFLDIHGVTADSCRAYCYKHERDCVAHCLRRLRRLRVHGRVLHGLAPRMARR